MAGGDGHRRLAIADFVFEHIDDPTHFLSEAARVLRPGWLPRDTDHQTLEATSACPPDSCRIAFIGGCSRARIPRVRPDDVFPTDYRCNTLPRIRAALSNAGFDAVVWRRGRAGLAVIRPADIHAWVAASRARSAELRVALVAWARPG